LSIFVGSSSDAAAHTVPNAQTLYDLCRAAEVVAMGRITLVPAAQPGSTTLPAVRVEVTELFRAGDEKTGPLWFLPHRHGNDEYVMGEEVLLFLERTRALERVNEAKYEAIDAIGDRFVVPVERRAVWIDAARKYVNLGKGPRNSTDPRALGRLSIAMLTSPETQLAQLALRDITMAGTSAVIAPEDVPDILRFVEDGAYPAMLRVGVLSELERRKLTPVGSHWVSVLESTPSSERSAVIAGAKGRWFVPEVNAALLSILDRGLSDEAISAARAVGAEGNDVAVDALVRAVTREPAELRFTALGSLRRINSVRARDKLEELSRTHPDPETRKVALAEVALLPSAPVAQKNAGKTNLATDEATNAKRRTWAAVGVACLFVALTLSWRTWRRRAKNAER
jgi:hypothetical protein